MNRNLVWIDLEMTGLSVERDAIIEIATIVTTSELDVVAEGPVLAIHQSEEQLAVMDEWNVTHHTASGLVDRVRASAVSVLEAEAATLEFVARHVEENAAPLCGNSIWQDRRFLARYMPTLEAYFHYRNIDVSSVKELARRWRPDVLAGVKKSGAHLALDDIRESIEELRHYRDSFFRLTP